MGEIKMLFGRSLKEASRSLQACGMGDCTAKPYSNVWDNPLQEIFPCTSDIHPGRHRLSKSNCPTISIFIC